MIRTPPPTGMTKKTRLHETMALQTWDSGDGHDKDANLCGDFLWAGLSREALKARRRGGGLAENLTSQVWNNVPCPIDPRDQWINFRAASTCAQRRPKLQKLPEQELNVLSLRAAPGEHLLTLGCGGAGGGGSNVLFVPDRQVCGMFFAGSAKHSSSAHLVRHKTLQDPLPV